MAEPEGGGGESVDNPGVHIWPVHVVSGGSERQVEALHLLIPQHKGEVLGVGHVLYDGAYYLPGFLNTLW